MTRGRPVVPLLLFWCAHALADPTRGFEIGADLHVGAATTPFFTAEFPEATGRGGALVVRGLWRIEGGFGVGLSVPVVLVRLREAAGPNVDEPAWGNPMFWGERRVVLAEGRPGHVDGWLRLGVGAPLADSGSSATLSKNRSLAVADAISGWQNRESFIPGVVPATVTVGVELDGGTVRGEGEAKLVPMLRIDDAYLPGGKHDGFALSALAGLGGSIWPFPELGFGARAYLVIDAVPEAVSARARTLQFVLSPGLSIRVGTRVRVGTELVFPIAGALGGDTFALGLHAAVDW